LIETLKQTQILKSAWPNQTVIIICYFLCIFVLAVINSYCTKSWKQKCKCLFSLPCSNCCQSKSLHIGYFTGNEQNWLPCSNPQVSMKAFSCTCCVKQFPYL